MARKWHETEGRRGRILGDVSESRQPVSKLAPGLSLDELAALADARPVGDASELLADIWDSDEELDAFLVDVRSSRDISLA